MSRLTLTGDVPATAAHQTRQELMNDGRETERVCRPVTAVCADSIRPASRAQMGADQDNPGDSDCMEDAYYKAEMSDEQATRIVGTDLLVLARRIEGRKVTYIAAGRLPRNNAAEIRLLRFKLRSLRSPWGRLQTMKPREYVAGVNADLHLTHYRRLNIDPPLSDHVVSLLTSDPAFSSCCEVSSPDCLLSFSL